MPKRVVQLSDAEVKNAKAKKKPYKLSDGKGLYLLVTPTGGKLWRYDYRFGTRKTLSLNTYPEISLDEARHKHKNARALLAKGIDPGAAIKEEKALDLLQAEKDANTFRIVAEKWIANDSPVWSSDHKDTVEGRLRLHVYPTLGDIPISEITRNHVKEIMLRVAARGTIETASRLKIYCGQICNYALNNGMIAANPIDAMKGILPKRVEEHHAALVKPKEVAALLRAIDGYEGTFVVCSAFKLAPLVFLRPGELRAAEWSEIDFEKALWDIPAGKMKMKVAHLVPLSRQAIEILKGIHPLTGGGKYVFPCIRSNERCMSENTLTAALRRMGYPKEQMTVHGFRATARTLLAEELHCETEHMELQLAHEVKDANGRAYNRAAFLADRRIMMQRWADYLDELKTGIAPVKMKVGGNEEAFATSTPSANEAKTEQIKTTKETKVAVDLDAIVDALRHGRTNDIPSDVMLKLADLLSLLAGAPAKIKKKAGRPRVLPGDDRYKEQVKAIKDYEDRVSKEDKPHKTSILAAVASDHALSHKTLEKYLRDKKLGKYDDSLQYTLDLFQAKIVKLVFVVLNDPAAKCERPLDATKRALLSAGIDVTHAEIGMITKSDLDISDLRACESESEFVRLFRETMENHHGYLLNPPPIK